MHSIETSEGDRKHYLIHMTRGAIFCAISLRGAQRRSVSLWEEQMSRSWSRCAIVVACLFALATGHVGARQALVFSTIDFPGAVLTAPQGINAGGEIVGFYNDAGTPSRT